MKATFNCDVELTIVTNLNQDDEPEEEQEFFKKGTPITFDLIDYAERVVDGNLVPDKDLWNIQFGDGSMAFCVSKEWLTDISVFVEPD